MPDRVIPFETARVLIAHPVDTFLPFPRAPQALVHPLCPNIARSPAVHVLYPSWCTWPWSCYSLLRFAMWIHTEDCGF